MTNTDLLSKIQDFANEQKELLKGFELQSDFRKGETAAYSAIISFISGLATTPNKKTVAELIKELSALDQSKPIWIHYDMAYSQIPEIGVADSDTHDCNDRIKPGDYLI